MPRVSRHNPRANSSVDESAPPKKPSQRTTAKKPSSPSSKGTKAKAKAPPEGPHPKNSATATTGVATPQKRRGKEIVTLPSQRKSARLEIDATHTKRRTIRAIDDQSVVDELRQKGGGKSERETRTSVGELMGGGATTKCGDSIDEVIDLQSPVAAAASTVLYSTAIRTLQMKRMIKQNNRKHWRM
jgi:hypothetical protein